MRICKIDKCNNKHFALGWCSKHYQRNYAHGNPYINKKKVHGMFGTLTYNSWDTLIQRCNNLNCPTHKHYGGRGIKVCDRWLDFRNFLTDMGERPIGLEIDRIDNDGDYEPDNCHWVTHKENNRNTRRTVLNMKIAEEVRALHKKGMKPKKISEVLNIKIHSISSILYNNYWK